VPSGIVFSGYQPNWDNPAQGSYAVYAEANCGQGALPKISCGTLTVRAARLTFTDTRDNKTYTGVAIGTQTWMAENLNYAVSGSKCLDVEFSVVDNNTEYCDTYGRLYDWETAMTVCPTGWHLSSRAEWDTLVENIGDASGTKKKKKSGWDYNGIDGNGTNDYGFSALPGGRSNLESVGYSAYWWSASEFDNRAQYYTIVGYDDDVFWGNDDKSNLLSVRCVKD
jgi:uncharacterized protein (TIGR02145 family)